MTRDILPQRRAGETVEFAVGNMAYTATLGRYPDGRLGEIFLRSGKAGSHAAIASIETAVAVSFALQHGVPAEAMRAAMPRTSDGAAEGAMGTLLDLLAEGAR